MNRRVWTGVLAGVLAATVLLTVGVGAYRAGQDDEVVTRTVTNEEGNNGDVVRVVHDDRDWGWHRGPGFGFFLFPLLLIFGFIWLVGGRRRHWGHGYGYGYRGGWGPGGGPCGPEGRIEDWHRRAHGQGVESPPGESSTAPAPQGTAAGEPTETDPTGSPPTSV